MVRETSNNACFFPYQKDIPLTTNLERTFGLVIGSRPFRLRSEIMAEYDNVDIKVLSNSVVRSRVGLAAWRTRRIVYGLCVFLMKMGRRFKKPSRHTVGLASTLDPPHVPAPVHDRS
jgi:hypothetical protein